MSLDTVSASLATPVKWLLVLLIAYSLAQGVLFFVGGAGTAPAVPGTGTSGQTQRPQRPEVDLNAILARNLFGDAGAVAQPVVQSNLPAVATRLPLELQGVFVAGEGDTSAAIIAQRGKAGMLYHVGEMLPGSVELAEVHRDHVILRRAGTRERLDFPTVASNNGVQSLDEPEDLDAMDPLPDQDQLGQLDDQARFDDSAAPEESGNELGQVAPADELAEQYRERLESDPEGALQELGIAPVEAGSASGYRIDDLAQSPYLSQTGLQPGDVILSVNGRPVGDLNQDRLELENVLAQGSARIEVQRGTRRFFVTASLR
ncbi:MAG: type II secretion system protein N [Pseudomonadales bacterium]